MTRLLESLGRMRTGLVALVLSICLAGGLLACQVPVFRFALERWPADNFRLVVTSKGPLEKGLREKLDYLEEQLDADSRPINVELEVIDLSSLSEAQRLSIPGLEHAGDEPTIILVPPASWKLEEPAWTGAASAGNLDRLLDSPARQRCADHLVKGESAVWIVVESGDAEKDARAKALLSAGLAKASAELEVPVGVVRREDLGNREFENLDLDDVLRSDIPLKISFATESISRDDVAESLFLPILAEPDALASGEPLIVPVFGRGRTPGALPASQITVDRIFGACEYLCGACSCQVKEGNPGYDLLFKMGWDAHLNSTVITADSEIVQKVLDVVTFNAGEKDEAAAKPAARTRKGPSLPIVIVLVVIAVGALIFTSVRKPAESS